MAAKTMHEIDTERRIVSARVQSGAGMGLLDGGICTSRKSIQSPETIVD